MTSTSAPSLAFACGFLFCLLLAGLSACGGGGGGSKSSGSTAPGLVLSLDEIVVGEGEEVLEVILRRATAGGAATVALEYGGDAQPGQDFAPVAEVEFGANQLELTLELLLSDDASDEFDESLEVRVTEVLAGPELDLSDAFVVATLVDDDDPPRVEFALAGQQANEQGGSVEVPLILSVSSGKHVSARLSVAGDATEGTDYTLDSDTVTFDPGEVEASLPVTLLVDSVAEPAESIVFSFAEVIEAEIGAASEHSLSIVDRLGSDLLLRGFQQGAFAGLWSASLEEGPEPFVSLPTPSVVKDFHWSPRGARVAYLADPEVSGRFDLWVVDAEGQNPVRLSDPVVVGGEIDEFAWSPDGEWLAYQGDSRVPGVHELFTVPAAGGDVQRVNWTSGPDTDVQAFAWSPVSGDNRLAYRSDATLFDEDVYVVDVDGTGNKRLSPVSLGRVSQFAWSPVGDEVAFLGLQGSSYHLFVTPVDLGATSARKRTLGMGLGGTVAEFTWVTGGQDLVFRAAWAGFGQYEILAVDKDAGPANVLSDLGSGTLLDPLWQAAPDGQRVAFQADLLSGGGYELYTVALDGSDKQVVSDPLAELEDVDGLAWSPDSTSLTYLLRGPESRSLHLVAGDGSGSAQQLSADDHDVLVMSWDPTATRVAYSALVPGTGALAQLFSAQILPDIELLRISGAPQSGFSLIDFRWAAGGARLVYTLGSGIVPDELHSGKPFLPDTHVLLSGDLTLVLDYLAW